MKDRELRAFEAVGSAGAGFFAASISAAWVLYQTESEGVPVAGLFALAGLCIAVFAYRMILGRSEKRWTLSQALVFLLNGKELDSKEAAARTAVDQFISTGPDGSTDAINGKAPGERAQRILWEAARDGKVRLEGLRVRVLNADAAGTFEAIHPALFTSYFPKYASDNSISFSQSGHAADSGFAKYNLVVAYADEIRELRKRQAGVPQ